VRFSDVDKFVRCQGLVRMLRICNQTGNTLKIHGFLGVNPNRIRCGTFGADFTFKKRSRSPMHAKEFTCRVLEGVWITPTVLKLRFEPNKKFNFEPGQFLSIQVPTWDKKARPPKRCYSFSNSPEEAKKDGYEICLKRVEGGAGTSYLSSLKPGDKFQAFAPYGDFQYRPPSPGRGVCFIATGTGVGPFRSVILSKKFLDSAPSKAMCIMGARTQDEVIVRGVLERVGVQTVYAVSQPVGKWGGFHGRVTDYLRSLPANWAWHSMDFYLCGNGQMVSEVSEILKGGHGVADRFIHKEAFNLTPIRNAAAAVAEKKSKEGEAGAAEVLVPEGLFIRA
jgi:ferredoxin-NADP reductase